MTKRILIDSPDQKAHKTRLENTRQMLAGKRIKDLKQEELAVLVELLASRLALLDGEGKFRSN